MSFGDTVKFFGQSLSQSGTELASSVAQNAINEARGIAQNAASQAINKGLSYVPEPLRGLAGSLVNQLTGGFPYGCLGGSVYSAPEDFNYLRLLNKKLVSAEFVQEWNFRLEIEDQPPDFDLYVKDISYSGFELGNDEEHYGSSSYAWPNIVQTQRMSFTARENYDLRIATFLHGWKRKVAENDGTVGLPFGKDGYLKKIILHNIKSSGEDAPQYSMLAYPLQYGDANRSHENGQFLEMPVTLVLFSTNYFR